MQYNTIGIVPLKLVYLPHMITIRLMCSAQPCIAWGVWMFSTPAPGGQIFETPCRGLLLSSTLSTVDHTTLWRRQCGSWSTWPGWRYSSLAGPPPPLVLGSSSSPHVPSAWRDWCVCVGVCVWVWVWGWGCVWVWVGGQLSREPLCGWDTCLVQVGTV